MTNLLKTFLVLFLMPEMASGQVLNDSVVKYNRLINKAELNVCDGNFVQADKLYAQAFKLNPDKTFAIDLYTAFHCAMDAADYQAAENYLKTLLSRGINTDFINRRILGPYSGQKRNIVDNIIQKCPNNINRNDSLNTAINKLGKRDQGVRAYFAQNNESGDYMADSVYKVDLQNAFQLLQIIKTIGHFPNADEISNIDDYPLAGSYADLIILHNLQDHFMGKQPFLFDSVLYQSIQSFDFMTSHFTNLLSHCYFRENGGYNDFHYKDIPIDFPIGIVAYWDMGEDGKVYFEAISNEEESKINTERQKLGLSTLQEMRKKIYFGYLQNLKEGKYIAFGGNNVIYYMFSTHKQIEKDLNKPNPIREYQP